MGKSLKRPIMSQGKDLKNKKNKTTNDLSLAVEAAAAETAAPFVLSAAVDNTLNASDAFSEPNEQAFDPLLEQLERDISEIFASLEFLGKKIDKLGFSIQERQELKEENLQEKLTSSLEPITELSEQSKQMEESLTKEEQEITVLENLIEYKQNKIKTNENEIQNSPFRYEQKRIKLEKQITDLKNQIFSLQDELIEKGKELANLNQENNKLIKQYRFYLPLIKSSEKQKEEIIIVEQISTKGERPKKRYWKPEELLVDQITIDNWDRVLAEMRGYELPKEKINFDFFEEMCKIIKSCNKNTVKSVLLTGRINKDKFGLVNTYNEVTSKGKEIIEKMIISLNDNQISLKETSRML